MSDGADETRATNDLGAPPRGEWLVLMWPLALEAWSLMGVAIPDSDRASMPVRKIVLGDK